MLLCRQHIEYDILEQNLEAQTLYACGHCCESSPRSAMAAIATISAELGIRIVAIVFRTVSSPCAVTVFSDDPSRSAGLFRRNLVQVIIATCFRKLVASPHTPHRHTQLISYLIICSCLARVAFLDAREHFFWFHYGDATTG